MDIDILIQQWQEKHVDLLLEYRSRFKAMSERELIECRSHMQSILHFIQDLKQIKNNK